MPNCDVGLLFATGTEQGGLDDRLEQKTTIRATRFTVRRGLLRGRSLAVVTSGVGGTSARRACEILIAGHRPRLIVSAGFAGGLDPRVKRGDFLSARSVVNGDGGEIAVALEPDSPPPRAGQLHVGRLLTVDRIVARPEDKAALGRRFDALAVDMETWEVADVCRQASIDWVSLRVISDAVDESLPPEIERVARQPNTPRRVGAALGVLLQRPSRLKNFLKLRLDGVALSAELAAYLETLIVRLVPAPTPLDET